MNTLLLSLALVATFFSSAVVTSAPANADHNALKLGVAKEAPKEPTIVVGESVIPTASAANIEYYLSPVQSRSSNDEAVFHAAAPVPAQETSVLPSEATVLVSGIAVMGLLICVAWAIKSAASYFFAGASLPRMFAANIGEIKTGISMVRDGIRGRSLYLDDFTLDTLHDAVIEALDSYEKFSDIE